MSYKNTRLGEFTCGNTFNSYKANENLITENSIITLKKKIYETAQQSQRQSIPTLNFCGAQSTLSTQTEFM